MLVPPISRNAVGSGSGKPHTIAALRSLFGLWVRCGCSVGNAVRPCEGFALSVVHFPFARIAAQYGCNVGELLCLFPR